EFAALPRNCHYGQEGAAAERGAAEADLGEGGRAGKKMAARAIGGSGGGGGALKKRCRAGGDLRLAARRSPARPEQLVGRRIVGTGTIAAFHKCRNHVQRG